MVAIRRLVLDVLKPHEPSLLELTKAVGNEESVSSINASLYEIDEKVENIKVTVQGDDIDFEAVKQVIEENAGSIHSVDEAVCGNEIIDASETPQD
ncbi:MAG: DUF211 domain-containing protein [Candidatus Nanohaloarchaeota archaeon QJJ-5]|nr:DUF211 domain-containing protein [Candidatus Nanohaloarchaeota archaeon QJJ-5]